MVCSQRNFILFLVSCLVLAANATETRPKRLRHRGLIKIEEKKPEDIYRDANEFGDEEERALAEEDVIRALQLSRDLQGSLQRAAVTEMVGYGNGVEAAKFEPF